MNKIGVIFLLICGSLVATAQTVGKKPDPPGLSAITLKDLTRDLYEMAGDHFRGRESGTLDELKASVWWAEKMRSAGLTPAGDDGTFFQFFSLWRNRIDPESKVRIGDRSLKVWDEVLIAQIAPCSVDAQLLYIGKAGEPNEKVDIRGKAVVVQAATEGINMNLSIMEWRYHRAVMNKYGNDLLARGAAAIIFISDEFGEKSWDFAKENLRRGLYDIPGGPNVVILNKPPVLWVRKSAAEWIRKEGLTLKAMLTLDTFEYPSVNIVGKIEGSDPALSKEYVLFSGHQDAHGIRNRIDSDTVYRGADDNASVNVAMLATARAFKKSPAKRSALFVFHGAEERGLMGSRWYSLHATVPFESIIAVLNGDMIGRNNPDSAALMGIQPPHRNSKDLVDMALEANNEGPKFKLDRSWDRPEHPEFWYFRSDHLPYAWQGIPAIMYTTLLNPDYHTPRDHPKNIDYNKLLRMTQWIYRTGWKVANAPQRPKADPDFKLER